MTAQNIYTQLGEDIPVCNISQGTQPFVGPLASPETVSSHPELGVINHLRFRDPEHFRAGIIHSRLPVARWTSLKSSVRGFEWSVFSVLLKETSRDNFIMLIHLPPFSLKTPLHVHSSRISSVTLLSYGCLLGCYQFGEKLELSPPQLILPLTVEPSKPRLCNDERFLNLWIKDLPFKLDHLSDLPRYVTWAFPDYDKSGYQHVRLHPSSETYFGLEWGGFFFVFRTLPFGWKASAFIYHNLGLVVSHAARSLGIPLSQYIDDRHVGQLFSSPALSVSLPSAQKAEAAAYIVCYILIEAGYFINIGKSQHIPSTLVRFLGFLCDSLR